MSSTKLEVPWPRRALWEMLITEMRWRVERWGWPWWRWKMKVAKRWNWERVFCFVQHGWAPSCTWEPASSRLANWRRSWNCGLTHGLFSNGQARIRRLMEASWRASLRKRMPGRWPWTLRASGTLQQIDVSKRYKDSSTGLTSYTVQPLFGRWQSRSEECEGEDILMALGVISPGEDSRFLRPDG